MKDLGNTEKTFNKRHLDNRLLYSLFSIVFSVLLFPLSSFATHSKVFLESADALGGNARFAYAATPAIQPSTGDTLSIAVTYDLLHIIKDHLESIRAILTSDGNIRERHDYYPFGLRTDQSRAYPTLSDRYTVKVPRLTQGLNGTITQTGYRSTAPYTLQYNDKELQLLANTSLIDYGARQYNPTLARWTAQDPMIEKYYGISPYAYCAGNPVMFVDVEGNVIIVPDWRKVWTRTTGALQMVGGVAQVAAGGGFAITTSPTIVGAAAGVEMSTMFIAPKTPNVTNLSKGFGKLSNAEQFGIGSYKAIKKAVNNSKGKNSGLVVHHLIEKRFAPNLGLKQNEMLSIVVTPAEHQVFTNAWRSKIPYKGAKTTSETTKKASRVDIQEAAAEIYENYPDIIKALQQKGFLK